MGPTKRLVIIGAAIAMFSHLFLSEIQVHANEETYFVTTAYYSPLPGQTRYVTGSYSGDVRLNGEGVNTASGGGVFQGLLAGPRNYPFGTKIYLEGFGIGSIEDRGGAIVKAGQRGYSYDRIDIWMGYGDEGLERALRWGKRTIKGKIVVPSAEVSISFPESKIGSITKLTVNPEDSISEDVKKLQEIFTKAKLYDGEIDGQFESIKNELIDFQIKAGIIDTPNHSHAGWYGERTIAALREKYGTGDTILNEEPVKLFSQYNHKVASEKYKIILEHGDLIVEPNSDIDSVKSLQVLLTELGEYDGPIDGKYSTVEDELINLQIKIGLINSKNDTWAAGYFGNKTRSALWTYYEKEGDTIIFEEQGLAEAEKNRMKLAYNAVVQKLKNDEKKGAPAADLRLKNLEKQIDNALPSVTDTKLRLKLEYLRELI